MPAMVSLSLQALFKNIPENQVDLLVETSSDTVSGAVFDSLHYMGTFNNTNYNQNLAVAQNLYTAIPR